jgi:hypothetical protein
MKRQASPTAIRSVGATKTGVFFASRTVYWLQRLAVRVTAIACAESTTEQPIVGRYAGRRWCDATERALADDLMGLGRNKSFPP